MMSEIRLIKEDDYIKVFAPYNADFVRSVKKLGARWLPSEKAWKVKEEREEGLINILMQIYNYSGKEEMEYIEVNIKAKDFEDDNTDTIHIGSITLVRRPKRDSEVILNNCFIVGGDDFPKRGGSSSYPRPKAPDNTILRCTIPSTVYEMLDDDKKSLVEIIHQKSKLEKLEEKKEKLLQQLAEIEKEIEKESELM